MIKAFNLKLFSEPRIFENSISLLLTLNEIDFNINKTINHNKYSNIPLTFVCRKNNISILK
jgi:hypothetical protein